MVNFSRLVRVRATSKQDAREVESGMPFQKRPMIGALLIGAFITVCLGWLFEGSGRAVPLWGYPLVFAVFVAWLYTVGRLLIGDGHGDGPVRSFDISGEVQ